MARLQAETGQSIVNRLHECVSLDPLQRQVLLLCDGTRDVAAVAAALTERLAQDAAQAGRPAETERITRYVAEAFPDALSSLARRALLVE